MLDSSNISQKNSMINIYINNGIRSFHKTHDIIINAILISPSLNWVFDEKWLLKSQIIKDSPNLNRIIIINAFNNNSISILYFFSAFNHAPIIFNSAFLIQKLCISD